MNCNIINQSEGLTLSDISTLNKLEDGTILVFKNTKGLTSEVVNKIKTTLIFRIIGGLNEELNPKYKFEEYYKSTLYNSKQLAVIIKQFEIIEKEINPSWDELTKALYVYHVLLSNIEYDILSKENIQNSSNLFGIVTRNINNEGLSLIYKELMDRIGIKTEYLGTSDIIKIIIDNKNYLIKLTYDSMNKIVDSFGYDPNIDSDYNIENSNDFVILSKEEKEKMMKSFNNVNEEIIKNSLRIRIDGSKYLIKQLNTFYEKLYVYIQCEYENDNLKEPHILYSEYPITEDKYVELTCSRHNITHALYKNGYLGNDPEMTKYFEQNFVQESFYRSDNTSFTLFKTNKVVLENLFSYNYVDITSSGEDIIIRIMKIFSKDNLLDRSSQEKDFIANSLLNQDRLNTKITSFGGFIGNMYLPNGSFVTL